MLPLVKQMPPVVLAVDVQQQRAQVAQLRRRDRNAADTAGCFALRSDLAADDELIVALDLVFVTPRPARPRVKRRANNRFFRARSHEFTRGARAKDRVHGVHEDGFARASLAGQNVQARPELKIGTFNDRDIFNMQFSQQSASPPAARQSSFSISWKSSSADVLSFISKNAVSSPASVPTRVSMCMLSSAAHAAEASPGRVLMTMMFCASA